MEQDFTSWLACIRALFSVFLLSMKTSERRHDLTPLLKSQTVVVPVIFFLFFFISGRSLCISLPVCVSLLIFSHPACPSSSVSSWRFDSVTVVKKCLPSCGGLFVSRSEMSVLVLALCVGVCLCLCACVLVCGYFRCVEMHFLFGMMWFMLGYYCLSLNCHSRFVYLYFILLYLMNQSMQFDIPWD